MTLLDIDAEVIVEYLDNAQMHGARDNRWAEGYWIGRAVQHWHQNHVDRKWFVQELKARGLDSAVLAEPWPGQDFDPRKN